MLLHGCQGLERGLLRNNRIVRRLDDSVDSYHARLRVYGTKGIGIGRPHPLVQEVGEHVVVVPNEECVRHVGQLLGVLLGQVQGGSNPVGDDVIHVIGSTAPWVP